jgi:hypothetical protein
MKTLIAERMARNSGKCGYPETRDLDICRRSREKQPSTAFRGWNTLPCPSNVIYGRAWARATLATEV